ncbi:PREDICTED: uncharacterized protein LOC108356109 [Rhagoletis zephyria]|uniref:uncharacterized protein LOC108356109 n=1 Tax=Rhagoletis zephyria TaxID=28612 RepID=UPI0008116619|nr:PREDICTED: uncharacterized protein LOC108356109 [Rhagoletis zephyria]
MSRAQSGIAVTLQMQCGAIRFDGAAGRGCNGLRSCRLPWRGAAIAVWRADCLLLAALQRPASFAIAGEWTDDELVSATLSLGLRQRCNSAQQPTTKVVNTQSTEITVFT